MEVFAALQPTGSEVLSLNNSLLRIILMDQDSESGQKVYLVRRTSSFLILVLPLFKLFKSSALLTYTAACCMCNISTPIQCTFPSYHQLLAERPSVFVRHCSRPVALPNSAAQLDLCMPTCLLKNTVTCAAKRTSAYKLVLVYKSWIRGLSSAHQQHALETSIAGFSHLLSFDCLLQVLNLIYTSGLAKLCLSVISGY